MLHLDEATCNDWLFCNTKLYQSDFLNYHCFSITESDVNNSFWFCSPLKPVFAMDTDVGYYQYPQLYWRQCLLLVQMGLPPVPKCTEDNVCCWYRCGLPPVPKCTEDCCWDRYEILPVPQVYWRQCLLLKQMWGTTCTSSVLKTMFTVETDVRCCLYPKCTENSVCCQMWVTTNTPSVLKRMFAVTDVGYYLYPEYTEKQTRPKWELPPAEEEGIMDVLPASLWMWW